MNFFILEVKVQTRYSLPVSSFLHIEVSETTGDAVPAPKCCGA